MATKRTALIPEGEGAIVTESTNGYVTLIAESGSLVEQTTATGGGTLVGSRLASAFGMRLLGPNRLAKAV